VAEPLEKRVERRCVDSLVPDVDDDRHSHHELDAAEARPPVVGH